MLKSRKICRKFYFSPFKNACFCWFRTGILREFIVGCGLITEKKGNYIPIGSNIIVY